MRTLPTRDLALSAAPALFGSLVGLALGATACAATSPRPPSEPLAAGHHRIAMVQYEIRGDASLDELRARLVDAVGQAARGGAELVVFPELAVLDAWPLDDEGSEREITEQIAREITPGYLDAARAAARDHHLAVLPGSVPLLEEDRLFNAAVVFFADGRRVRQDKNWPTPWGRSIGLERGDGVLTFDAPWGRTAILVCYDVEFPAVSAQLVDAAPEVLLVPSMTESPQGRLRVRWTAQARAVEHFAYVVVASTVGRPTPEWRHYGRSVVLTPQSPGFEGVLAEAPADVPTLLFADLDLAKLRRERARAGFHPARDQSSRSEREPEPGDQSVANPGRHRERPQGLQAPR